MSVRYEGMAIRFVQTSNYKDSDGKRKSVKSVVGVIPWDTSNMPQKLVAPQLLEMGIPFVAATTDIVKANPEEFALATDNDRRIGRYTMVTFDDGTKKYYRTDKRGNFVPRTYGRKAYLQEFITTRIAWYIAHYGIHDMGIDYSAADVARLNVRVEVTCGVDVMAVGSKRHIH